MYSGTLTQIPGIRVGHAQNQAARTGVTVVLCADGAVAGVDVRGAAPGTRETDLLKSENTVQQVHGVALCGGSAFGLAAADGVMRYLEEQGAGFDVGVAKVPIVPAAVLFDLGVGDAAVRPDAAMGYAACQSAADTPVPQGRVGAGCGATVGKVLGPRYAQNGGVGSAAMTVGSATVAALVAVNAVGDVVDYRTGDIVAGARAQDGSFIRIQNILATLGQNMAQNGQNTTIGVVATDAKLTKPQANRLATAAQDGIAWAIRPSHTPMDGDTLFALCTGQQSCDFSLLCAAAAEVVARAILNAVEAGND
ncbi:MAG: P1 family peptidase [Eubacteriales bacterium]|nr:P1 family peptidase [Eubacteriales bacterium]